VSENKTPQPDRQSLIRAQDARARRDIKAVLTSAKKLGESPLWREQIRPALEKFREAYEQGRIPQLPERGRELLSPPDALEETRNVRLDEIWRRMRAQSEEERNAWLDAQWRELEEEPVADRANVVVDQAPTADLEDATADLEKAIASREDVIAGWKEAVADWEESRAATEMESAARRQGRPPTSIPRWENAMIEMKQQLKTAPWLREQPARVADILWKWLKDNQSVVFIDPNSRRGRAGKANPSSLQPNEVVISRRTFTDRVKAALDELTV